MTTTRFPAAGTNGINGIKALRDGVRGPVLLPGDEGYDDALAGFQTASRHRPALVVGAEETADVRAAVGFAAARGLPVAVQATGHGLSVVADGGVLIVARRMREVRVDARARTAWFGAGVVWGQVVEAAAPHGLAPLSGSAAGVGAVSYTLGGGIGLLARQFGYAADQVRGAEIVTADGASRYVTAQSDPELFWALRGAGHNFGVVTGLEVNLVPVDRVFGGGLYFEGALVEDVLRTYAGWSTAVPEEMTSSVGLIAYPDLPQLPAALRGRYAAHVRIAFNGDAAEGERLVAPLRAIGPRLVDDLGELPYSEGESIYKDPPFPHAYTGTNAMLRELDPAALGAVRELTGPDRPLMTVVDLRHLGGALSREPAVASAVGNRDARYILRVITMLDGPDDIEQARRTQERVLEVLAPWTTGSSLPFLYGDGERAGEEQTRTGYAPDAYRRLRELKARLDPANLFRFNRNISPAPAPASPAPAPTPTPRNAASHI